MWYSFTCKSLYHKKIFCEHVFIKISYCVFKIMKMKKKTNVKFLNLGTENFLAIWPYQYKFLLNEFLIKKCVIIQNYNHTALVSKRFFEPVPYNSGCIACLALMIASNNFIWNFISISYCKFLVN